MQCAKRYFCKITTYIICAALAWDEQVMMPSKDGAVKARGMQNATLSGIIHEMSTSSKIAQLLEQLAVAPSELNEYERAVVRLQQKDYTRRTKLPKEMVEEKAALDTKGYATWVNAKHESSFAKFEPILQRWVEIKKDEACRIDSQKPAYDVLIDEYEPGVTMQQLDQIFAVIKARLVPLIQKIAAKQGVDSSFLRGPEGTFPIAQQAELNRILSKSVGYSFAHGRLDVSVHPFMKGITPYDVRITTRYDTNEFIQVFQFGKLINRVFSVLSTNVVMPCTSNR